MSPEGSQKKISAHGLVNSIDFNCVIFIRTKNKVAFASISHHLVISVHIKRFFETVSSSCETSVIASLITYIVFLIIKKSSGGVSNNLIHLNDSAEDITKSNTKGISKRLPSTSIKLRDKLDRNDEFLFTSFSYSVYSLHLQGGWFCDVYIAFVPTSRGIDETGIHESTRLKE